MTLLIAIQIPVQITQPVNQKAMEQAVQEKLGWLKIISVE